jgi:hypothetical protein
MALPPPLLLFSLLSVCDPSGPPKPIPKKDGSSKDAGTGTGKDASKSKSESKSKSKSKSKKKHSSMSHGMWQHQQLEGCIELVPFEPR